MARNSTSTSLMKALMALEDQIKTPEDLNTALKYIKPIREKFERLARYTFGPGDTASFMSKYGMIKTGKITQINRKTAYMVVDGVKWKVSLSLLKQPEVKGKVA